MINREKVLRHLQFIYPEEATNADLVRATGVKPHQQVFQITEGLRLSGEITGRQIRRTWHFKSKSGLGENVSHTPQKNSEVTKIPKLNFRQFESFARQVFSKKFGVNLKAGISGNVSKEWDMVSEDKLIVGDAKFFALVARIRKPPAKFSIISEHVWLLEKTNAKFKFLVFGNQVEVPKCWLEKYGDLANQVKFYFLDDSGKITLLNPD